MPFVSHKVIWDSEELCEILNHIEGFTEGREPQVGAFPSIDFKRRQLLGSLLQNRSRLGFFFFFIRPQTRTIARPPFGQTPIRAEIEILKNWRMLKYANQVQATSIIFNNETRVRYRMATSQKLHFHFGRKAMR